MSENPDRQKKNHPRRSDTIVLLLAVVCAVLLIVFQYLGWNLAFLIAATATISIVIWQACDPFAEAAQWVGRTYRLPGSVRGATLDAIASSLPELFSGIFFVVVAIAVLGDGSAMAEACGEGYGSTIATCAGSAIYNMILIPAACALVIWFSRKNKPLIEVETGVLFRDGGFFLLCEALLLVCLYQNTMKWWMAVGFLVLYALYIAKLYSDARAYRAAYDPVKAVYKEMGYDTPPRAVARALAQRGTRVAWGTIARIKDGLLLGRGKDGEDSHEGNHPERVHFLFGCCSAPLNRLSVWLVIGGATVVAAVACLCLVGTVRATAAHLGVPTFFVAVILAAAASSVPDMFLSIGAARRGDDSGAVSNAFGSNIFDICVCLSIPLLLCCYLNQWKPISLLQDGEPMAGLVGLRLLLWVLTAVTLVTIWFPKRQVTWRKALFLCALYGMFIAYAVLGSLGMLAIWDPVAFLSDLIPF